MAQHLPYRINSARLWIISDFPNKTLDLLINSVKNKCKQSFRRIYGFVKLFVASFGCSTKSRRKQKLGWKENWKMFAPNVWSFDPPNTQITYRCSESIQKHTKQICKRIHSHPFNRLVSEKNWLPTNLLLTNILCIQCVLKSKNYFISSPLRRAFQRRLFIIVKIYIELTYLCFTFALSTNKQQLVKLFLLFCIAWKLNFRVRCLFSQPHTHRHIFSE